MSKFTPDFLLIISSLVLVFLYCSMKDYIFNFQQAA